ncbi:hypothetical protein DRH27_04860 [Candidatus Falkowbacteria bacterium]|nr:MAG: hypothetical protein DRH27_04860 [Candidatus Falkowbacteria bacterium]
MKKLPGFTLMETICGLSLFLVVILLVGSIFILAQQTYNKSTSQNELVQNARVCFDRLSRELRQAETLITDVSATSTELYFQDGHNSDEITYIKYHLIGTDLYRTHKIYYFPPSSLPIPPEQYTYYNSVDEWGASAASTTLESKIIGEYFDSLEFYGENGLITVTANFKKGNENLNIDTKIYIRNY